MPSFVPKHREVILGSGVAELACAAGPAPAAHPTAAGWASAALLSRVFPGNLKMADDARRSGNTKFQAIAYGRLPLQLPMIRMAVTARAGDDGHRVDASSSTPRAPSSRAPCAAPATGCSCFMAAPGSASSTSSHWPTSSRTGTPSRRTSSGARRRRPTDGPFAVADHVADVVRVLDELGWERALVVGPLVGRSPRAARRRRRSPERLRAVPGGRSPRCRRRRRHGGVRPGAGGRGRRRRTGSAPTELDERVLRGEGTERGRAREPGAVWPAYFADACGRASDAADPACPTSATPAPSASILASSRGWSRACRHRPAGRLRDRRRRARSRRRASTDTAERIPGAWVDAVADAGHFVWLDAPGAVRSALDRLDGPGD